MLYAMPHLTWVCFTLLLCWRVLILYPGGLPLLWHPSLLLHQCPEELLKEWIKEGQLDGFMLLLLLETFLHHPVITHTASLGSEPDSCNNHRAGVSISELSGILADLNKMKSQQDDFIWVYPGSIHMNTKSDSLISTFMEYNVPAGPSWIYTGALSNS